MGGIFSAPSPPPPPAPLPAPEPLEDPAVARREMLARRRRGRAGTIATSDRGILRPRQPTDRRKSLLGE
jgi:hypothetical protein